MDADIVGDRNAGDIARDFGGHRRVVRLHVRVIGGHQKTPDHQIVVAEPAAGAGCREHDGSEYKLTAARASRREAEAAAPRAPAVGAAASRGAAAGEARRELPPLFAGTRVIDRLRVRQSGSAGGRMSAVIILVAIDSLYSSDRHRR
jgi:hypothetical protein